MKFSDTKTSVQKPVSGASASLRVEKTGRAFSRFLPISLGPLLLLALAAFVFAVPLATGRLLAGIDFYSHIYFLRHLTYGLLRSGNLPLWNPYVFCGMPLLGNLLSSAFYPLNAPFLFLPTRWALNLSVFVHVYLAGLFTWMFLRSIGAGKGGSFLGACSFMLGGFTMGYVFSGHMAHLIALAWMPLVFLCAWKVLSGGSLLKWGVLGGTVLGLQSLGGHPQIVCASMLGAALFSLFAWPQRTGFRRGLGRRFGWLVGVAVLGLLLSAIELIPAAEFSRESDRSAIREFSFATEDSLPPEKLITLAAPDFFGNMVNSPHWGRTSFWETTAFAGAATLIFALLALAAFKPVTGGLAAALLGCSLVALGRYTPAYELFYRFVPFFAGFRNPARFFAPSLLMLACLGGLGFDMAFQKAQESKKHQILIGIFALALFGITAGLLSAGGNSVVWNGLLGLSTDAPARVPLAVKNAFLVTAARSLLFASIVIAASAVFLFLGRGSPARVRIAKALVLVISLVQMLVFAYPLVRTTGDSLYTLPANLVDFLGRDLHGQRVGIPSLVFANHAANRPMLYGIPNAFGYEGQILSRYARFLSLAAPEKNRISTISHTQVLTDVDNPMLRLLAAKYLVSSPDSPIVPLSKQVPLYRSGEFSVYPFPGLPRASLVKQAIISESEEQTLRMLRSDEFNPETMAVLDEPPEHPLAGGDEPGETGIALDSPTQVVVKTRSEESSLLVLLDAYYPGWKAFIDGTETEILRADSLFRAVSLPPGEHTVRFLYRPLSFLFGALLSGFGILAVAAGLALARNKR